MDLKIVNTTLETQPIHLAHLRPSMGHDHMRNIGLCLMFLGILGNIITLAVIQSRYGLSLAGVQNFTAQYSNLDYWGPMRMGLHLLSLPLIGYITVFVISLILFRVRKFHVFISYNSKESDYAKLLQEKLEKQDIKVRRVPIEKRAQDKTVQLCISEIKKSDLVIIILKRQYVSKWQTAEWFASIYGNKIIILVQLGDGVRSRTSLSGYPVCSGDIAEHNPSILGSFIRAMLGSWEELALPVFILSILGGFLFSCMSFIAIYIIRWFSKIIPVFWPSTAQTFVWVRYSSYSLIFFVLSVSLICALLFTVKRLSKAYILRNKLSWQNKNRSTTWESLQDLISCCNWSKKSKRLILPPDAVSSELR